MTAQQYFTFSAGSLLLAVEVDRIVEVVRGLEITPVPGAPDSVVGVLNLRGQIVTTIDTVQRLGLHDSPERAENLIVVLSVGDDLVSFLIDREGEVIDLSGQQRSDVPDTVDARLAGFVVGTYQIDQGLLLTLDADKVFALEGSDRGTQVIQ